MRVFFVVWMRIVHEKMINLYHSRTPDAPVPGGGQVSQNSDDDDEMSSASSFSDDDD